MIPKVPFYFVRHGQTDWNVEGRLQGHSDIPLNETGIRQAHAAAERLMGKPITAIVSSDLCRARQTADIIAAKLRIDVVSDKAIRERTFGCFEGKITRDVLAAHGLEAHESITKILPSDAEQWPQTLERVRNSLGRWLEDGRGETYLFVGHGAFFRALYEHTHGVWLEAKNATPYLFTPTATAWDMREV